MDLSELFTEQNQAGGRKELINPGDIAIIGISLRLPFADNPDRFWELLSNSIDTVRLPEENRRRDCIYRNKLLQNENKPQFCEGSFLSEVDKFDAAYFGCTPREADYMSLIQRMLLTGSAEAIENAGYRISEVKSGRTGVFVGYIGDGDGGQYMEAMKQLLPSDRKAMAVTGNLSSVIAGHVSHFFDFHGPAVVVDTACSSSLTALHLAVRSLQCGDCEQAVVGSARVLAFPLKQDYELGMESPDGVTKAFDDSADGTGLGEGMVCMLLKPLERALEDHDSVYAVIAGTAVNQDGATLGITAPSAEAQEEVIVRAWKEAGVRPQDIDYIETHGTGTKLGDPVELTALERAVRRYTKGKQFCPIGSLKTNIGHLYETSGLAGVAKAIVCMEHRRIPPIRNFYEPNRMIDFVSSPVFIADRPLALPKQAVIGVSSFGFSGTNCHVILKSPPETEETGDEEKNSGFVFSARSDGALSKTLLDFADWLEHGSGRKVSLSKLSKALITERDQSDRSVCIEAGSHRELIRELRKAASAIPSYLTAEQKRSRGKQQVQRLHMPPTGREEKRHWFTDSLAAVARDSLNTIRYRAYEADGKQVPEDVLLICTEENRAVLCGVCGELPHVEPEFANAGLVYDMMRKHSCTGLLLCAEYIKEDTALQVKESETYAELILELARMLEKDGTIRSVRLIFVSRGLTVDAYPGKETDYTMLYPCALSGALRCEFAFAGVSVIDIDRAPESMVWVAENCGKTFSKHIAVRNGSAFVKQLEPLRVNNSIYSVKEDKCYVLLGGLGGIGSATALYLARNGARLIIAAQRREHPEKYRKLASQLSEYHCELQAVQCDICSAWSVEKLFRYLEERSLRVGGMVHCAGSAGGALLRNVNTVHSTNVISPKTDGLLNIERAIRNSSCCQGMDFLMLSSSAMTLADIPGQGQYSVGNYFMDVCVSRLRAKGIPACSVDWTAWSDAGMARDNHFTGYMGLMDDMTAEKAMEILPVLLCGSEPLTVAGKICSGRLRDHMDARLSVNILMDGSGHAVEKTKPEKAASVSSAEEVRRTIVECIKDVTGLESIGDEDNLLESGMDSITLSRIHESIEEAYPGAVMMSQMFVYPTVSGLSGYIYENLVQKSGDNKTSGVRNIDDAISLLEKM